MGVVCFWMMVPHYQARRHGLRGREVTRGSLSQEEMPVGERSTDVLPKLVDCYQRVLYYSFNK